MNYQVKDIVFQYGSYYFLLENNNADSFSSNLFLDIWVDGELASENCPFGINKKFILENTKLCVLECKKIPECLKKWKPNQQPVLLKVKEETIKKLEQQPKKYATKLERHKRKWWIFTWYD